jgi:hypothetical protein
MMTQCPTARASVAYDSEIPPKFIVYRINDLFVYMTSPIVGDFGRELGFVLQRVSISYPTRIDKSRYRSVHPV